jgi:hypothetical protein
VADARGVVAQRAIHDAHDRAVARITQPRRRLRNRVQHRLEVRGAAGDHPQHVGRRRLPLQRILELLSLHRQRIRDVHRATVMHRTTRRRGTCWRIHPQTVRRQAQTGGAWQPGMGPYVGDRDAAALPQAVDRRAVRLAEAVGCFRNRADDRQGVIGRAPDGAQDLTGRCLLRPGLVAFRAQPSDLCLQVAGLSRAVERFAGHGGMLLAASHVGVDGSPSGVNGQLAAVLGQEMQTARRLARAARTGASCDCGALEPVRLYSCSCDRAGGVHWRPSGHP